MILRYAVARCKDWERDEVYRIYITDAMSALIGVKDVRYADLVNGRSEPKQERSADEIINSIRGKLNA